MKRIFLICIILCGTFTGFAQAKRGERSTNPADTTRYLESKLSQNWFVSAYGSVNWWQGSDRIPAGNFTTLNGPSFGGGIYFGKWITHNIGLRLSYDVNQGKSYINGWHTKQQDRIGFLFGGNKTPFQTVVQPIVGDTLTFDYYKTSFVYHDIHVDVMISPRDLIEGYYFNRRYNPVILAGMGLATVSARPLIAQSIINPAVGEDINFELSYDVGLMNCFRINNYLDVDLTFMLQGQKYTIDSWNDEFNYDIPTADGGTETVRPKRADHNYKASLGLMWYVGGRIYEFPYRYVEVRKETNEIIQHIHDTVPCPEVVSTIAGLDTIKEIVSFPMSIFFNRDKHELMSGRDRVNLREIAKVAKEKGWTVHLRGSCDSATGNVEHNRALAIRRCNTIMNILIDMGVPEDKIELEPVGGIQELDPTEYDRRVLITLGKKIKNN